MAYLVAEDASVAEAILALSQLSVEDRRSAVAVLLRTAESNLLPVVEGE